MRLSILLVLALVTHPHIGLGEGPPQKMFQCDGFRYPTFQNKGGRVLLDEVEKLADAKVTFLRCSGMVSDGKIGSSDFYGGVEHGIAAGTLLVEIEKEDKYFERDQNFEEVLVHELGHLKMYLLGFPKGDIVPSDPMAKKVGDMIDSFYHGIFFPCLRDLGYKPQEGLYGQVDRFHPETIYDQILMYYRLTMEGADQKYIDMVKGSISSQAIATGDQMIKLFPHRKHWVPSQLPEPLFKTIDVFLSGSGFSAIQKGTEPSVYGDRKVSAIHISIRKQLM